MGWLEKATLDLSNAQYEPNVTNIVKDFVMENTWNTPFIIKTGHNQEIKRKVHDVLYVMTSYTTECEDEFEIIDV
jgi:hypothetical protein